jgi:hypothetical protein
MELIFAVTFFIIISLVLLFIISDICMIYWISPMLLCNRLDVNKSKLQLQLYLYGQYLLSEELCSWNIE